MSPSMSLVKGSRVYLIVLDMYGELVVARSEQKNKVIISYFSCEGSQKERVIDAANDLYFIILLCMNLYTHNIIK